MTFSPDGKHIASATNDQTKPWDSKRGKLLRSSYHLPRNGAATIDPQTNKVIYGSKEAWRYFCYKGPKENILEATL